MKSASSKLSAHPSQSQQIPIVQKRRLLREDGAHTAAFYLHGPTPTIWHINKDLLEYGGEAEIFVGAQLIDPFSPTLTAPVAFEPVVLRRMSFFPSSGTGLRGAIMKARGGALPIPAPSAAEALDKTLRELKILNGMRQQWQKPPIGCFLARSSHSQALSKAYFVLEPKQSNVQEWCVALRQEDLHTRLSVGLFVARFVAQQLLYQQAEGIVLGDMAAGNILVARGAEDETSLEIFDYGRAECIAPQDFLRRAQGDLRDAARLVLQLLMPQAELFQQQNSASLATVLDGTAGLYAGRVPRLLDLMRGLLQQQATFTAKDFHDAAFAARAPNTADVHQFSRQCVNLQRLIHERLADLF